MIDVSIKKGSRVRAEWFQSAPIGAFALAGVQAKTTGTLVAVTGTCAHFRGDHPTAPTEIRIYIDPDDALPEGVERVRPHGCTHADGHVEVRPSSIKAVL